MSDRPKWMPQFDHVVALATDQQAMPDDGAVTELEEEFERTGLRAKIAVLEEVVEELNGYSWAQRKIIELRKELGEWPASDCLPA